VSVSNGIVDMFAAVFASEVIGVFFFFGVFVVFNVSVGEKDEGHSCLVYSGY